MFNLPRFECTGPPTLFLFSSYNWVRCLRHGWEGRDGLELPYTANINNNNSNNEEEPPGIRLITGSSQNSCRKNLLQLFCCSPHPNSYRLKQAGRGVDYRYTSPPAAYNRKHAIQHRRLFVRRRMSSDRRDVAFVKERNTVRNVRDCSCKIKKPLDIKACQDCC